MATPTCCSSPPPGALTQHEAVELARRLKALADPTRLRLLSIIAAHEDAEACVCDLTEPVGLSQPTVSHHLKVLSTAGFVTREQRGVWAYYVMAPGAMQEIATLLGQGIAAPV